MPAADQLSAEKISLKKAKHIEISQQNLKNRALTPTLSHYNIFYDKVRERDYCICHSEIPQMRDEESGVSDPSLRSG